ncbi:MAG: hypothetical protein LBH57_04400 [Treponema sp.]|nr:hypothetical protein [Treponema sp.]
MIKNWEHFFSVVSTMRKHQKVYFKTKDPVALGQARKLEEIVDECIAARIARSDTKTKSHTGGN